VFIGSLPLHCLTNCDITKDNIGKQWYVPYLVMSGLAVHLELFSTYIFIYHIIVMFYCFQAPKTVANSRGKKRNTDNAVELVASPKRSGKKAKATVASPDDVRVVLGVVHPVDVKIEKGAEDNEEDESELEVTGVDLEDSDDEFGLSVIPTKPEDINRSIAVANSRGGDDTSGKRSGLKYFMQVFDIKGSDQFLVVPRIKYANNKRDCFKFKASYVKLAVSAMSEMASNFYLKQLLNSKVLPIRKVPHGSDIVSKNEKDYVDQVLVCTFNKGRLEDKDEAIDVVVKMMSKTLASEAFKEYYIGVLKEKGPGILKLMDVEKDELFEVLKAKRFDRVDEEALDALFVNVDIVNLLKQAFGKKAGTDKLADNVAAFGWKDGKPAGV